MKKHAIEQKLTSYGDFLLKRAMVPSGRERYFISWVRRFLQSSNSFKGTKWEDKLPQYLEQLESDPHIASWQVEQARQAVTLYFHNFPGSGSQNERPVVAQTSRPQARAFAVDKVVADLTEWLRIKHYAYKTE